MAPAGPIFVITGPSGVGKGTLIQGLIQRVPGLQRSVSATTRPPRPGERDGEDYYFLTPGDFLARVGANEFVEHVDYAGSRYGTLRSELERKAAAGTPVVLEIEVQGARQVRRALPEATQIFIAPPSLVELRARLQRRGANDPGEVRRRLGLAQQELAAQREFAHVVVNDELEQALDALEGIVKQEFTSRRTKDAEPRTP